MGPGRIGTMMVMETDALEQAAAWTYLHDLFRPPTPEQWEWLNSHPVGEAWSILAADLDADLPDALPLPAGFRSYEEEYIATFEVGVPQPPCPLIESHWNKREAVPRILHEHMLFYKRFGLALRSSSNETSDHLRHQLEFLAYLCRLEAEYLQDGKMEEARQVASARHEYLQRHTAYWTPLAAARITEDQPDSWPAAWVRLLAAWCSLGTG